MAVAPLVHAADEESTLSIAATIVESITLGIVGCCDDLVLQNAGCRRGPDAATERDDKSAVRTQRKRADRLRHRKHRVGAGCRIESVQRGCIDVDPIERLFGDGPYRTFAEIGLGVERACEGA